MKDENIQTGIIKILRNTSRLIFVVCCVVLFFVLSPNRKLQYSRALSEVKTIKKLQIDTLYASITKFLLSEQNEYIKYNNLFSGVDSTLSEKKFIVPVIIDNYIKLNNVYYDVDQLLQTKQWEWKISLPKEENFSSISNHFNEILSRCKSIESVEISFIDPNKGTELLSSKGFKKLDNYRYYSHLHFSPDYWEMNLIVSGMDKVGAHKREKIKVDSFFTLEFSEEDVQNFFPKEFIQLKSLGLSKFNNLPALEKIKDEIHNYNLIELEEYLELKLEDSTSTLSVFGILFDNILLMTITPIIIILLLVHLLIHLIGLRDIKNLNYSHILHEPWFPLYDSKISQISIWIIFLILPFGTIFTIYQIKDAHGFWSVFYVLIIHILALVLSLLIVGLLFDIKARIKTKLM